LTRYTSATDQDRERMLAKIGADSIDELFADVPEGVRLQRPLDLPDGKPEPEVFDRLAGLAERNAHAGRDVSFLGAGMYDHYIPAIVDSICQRSEFLTPYTPYQPEISQGTLQAMFEYQTAICELTGMPVSKSSRPVGVASSCRAACTRTAARRSRRTPSATGPRSRRCRCDPE
jgi:glycine dehydrogenase subunit 1